MRNKCSCMCKRSGAPSGLFCLSTKDSLSDDSEQQFLLHFRLSNNRQLSGCLIYQTKPPIDQSMTRSFQQILELLGFQGEGCIHVLVLCPCRSNLTLDRQDLIYPICENIVFILNASVVLMFGLKLNYFRNCSVTDVLMQFDQRTMLGNKYTHKYIFTILNDNLFF